MEFLKFLFVLLCSLIAEVHMKEQQDNPLLGQLMDRITDLRANAGAGGQGVLELVNAEDLSQNLPAADNHKCRVLSQCSGAHVKPYMWHGASGSNPQCLCCDSRYKGSGACGARTGSGAKTYRFSRQALYAKGLIQSMDAACPNLLDYGIQMDWNGGNCEKTVGYGTCRGAGVNQAGMACAQPAP